MSSDDPTKKFSGSDSDLLRQILARLESMESRLVSVESGQSALNQKVDSRLMDTRPIWEAMQVQLTELKATVDGLKTTVDGLKTDVDELKDQVKRGFRDAVRQTNLFLKEMNKVKTDLEGYDDRITELETRTA